MTPIKSDQVADLERRVVDLVDQYSKGIVVTRAYHKESTPSWEPYSLHTLVKQPEDDHEEIFCDESKREEALAALLTIGKVAVPTLVKILISERGDYPIKYSEIGDGVLSALLYLADENTSRELLEPFRTKLATVTELRLKDSQLPQSISNEQSKESDWENYVKYGNRERLYEEQIWSISLVWERHPIQEALPLLATAVRGKKERYNSGFYQHIFSEHLRESFFDAMGSIGTREAIMTLLTIGKEEAQDAHPQRGRLWCPKTWSPRGDRGLARTPLSEYGASNSHLFLRSVLKQKKLGEMLYDIYRSTEDREIREVLSHFLGNSKMIYWVKRKLAKK